MATGIRVRDANGRITFDTTIRTIRHVNSIVIPGGSSGSVNLANYNALVNFMFAAYSGNGSAGQMPYPEMSGTILSWTGASQDTILVLGITS